MAKIAIDAGHGLYTSGKRCHKTLDPNQTREWVLNSRVANELGILLKSAGHEILRVDDITGKTDVPLVTRVKKANDWGADFYISVHHDAAGKVTTASGTTVFVSVGCSKTSVKAQNAIYKHAIARADSKGNRSDGTRSLSYYVIKNTKMPACLIECGFMDSSVDIKFILDKAWSKKMALGIAEGICEVFGGTVNTSTTTTKTESTTTTTAKKSEKIDVTGKWDKTTTKLSQKVLGTTQDGIISNQPSVNKKYLPNAVTTTWQFKDSGYKDGSNLIRDIQKLTGVPEAERDGLFGKSSVKYMQKFLKKKGFYTKTITGTRKLDEATVIAWQKYLNSKVS